MTTITQTGHPNSLLTEDEWRFREIRRCTQSPVYFVHNYCKILDGVSKQWIDFHLWREQVEVLQTIHSNQKVIVLKARQLGLTWIGLSYALYQMLFEPVATVLLFSQKERESKALLGDKRLKGMYGQLPYWMQSPTALDSATYWQLDNLSSAQAFPATAGGDSFTASLAFVDEADLIDDFYGMLTALTPTIDAGGKLVIVSRSSKRRGTDSAFKVLYKSARAGLNSYVPVFLPWHVHPDRTQAWYDQQKRDAPDTDSLHEQYPATEEEALARGAIGKIYPMFSEVRHVSALADYEPGVEVFGCSDDGFTNPRVVLLAQMRFVDGREKLCIFYEYYERGKQYDETMDYLWGNPLTGIAGDTVNGYMVPKPDMIYADPAAAVWRAALGARGFGTWGAANDIMEGIKSVRHFIGKDLLLIHPRCKKLIYELSEYREREGDTPASENDPKPAPGQSDHAADALRYLIHTRFPWAWEPESA